MLGIPVFRQRRMIKVAESEQWNVQERIVLGTDNPPEWIDIAQELAHHQAYSLIRDIEKPYHNYNNNNKGGRPPFKNYNRNNNGNNDG